MLDSPPSRPSVAFDDLLQKFRAAYPVGSDDVVGVIRSLLEDVRDAHDSGKVVQLDRVDLLGVGANGELRLSNCPTEPPVLQDELLRKIQQPSSDAVVIVRQTAVREESGATAAWDRRIAEPGQIPEQPLFFRNYGSWELALGHHDALTDIFHLGLLAASLATGLDFRDPHQFSRFVQNRTNLIKISPRLHPVLSRAFADMTELARGKRAADLGALIDTFDDYRAVEVDDANTRASELAQVDDKDIRRQRTQEYFRNRLFEVSKRNKLLYYADRHGVDLTRGSFPLLLEYKTLKARQLLITGPDLLGQLAARNDGTAAVGELDLRRFLQCVDYPFLAPSLDKVRAAARKDLRELGFNQLRLVLAMLRWSDDDRGEQTLSPLVMLPVTLKKQAGTTDGFSLLIEGAVAEAEVNPVLRYVLAEKFKVQLPATLDLRNLDAIADLRSKLEHQMRRVKAGLAVAVIDKPRVQLIQKTIKRQLDEHRRRTKRSGQNLRDWKGIGYSYSPDSFQPLGYELFDRFVRAHAAPGREFANARADVTSSLGRGNLSDTAVAETYAFDSANERNPLNWEIDLCAVSLANFNTRKMSLVRDYEVLLDGYEGGHENYQRLFDHGARPELQPISKPTHSQRNFVLPSDPSQDDAILRAADGHSYVIQGPPGTGKSQTIANLLAELAARNKTVLFVCEKRVALDVVHNRLKDAGLGELACLVHDAREDRAEFIADLKTRYEAWGQSRATRNARDKRARVAGEIDALRGKLQAFSDAMGATVGHAETARSLMAYAISERIAPVNLESTVREKLPSWDAFRDGEHHFRLFEQGLIGLGSDREAVALATRTLRADFTKRERPGSFLAQTLADIKSELVFLSGLRDATANVQTIASLQAQCALAQSVRVLAENGKLQWLDHLDPEAARLRKQLHSADALEVAMTATILPNAGWMRKPTNEETEAALKLALQKEGGLFSFLSGDWRGLKRMIAENYKGAPSRVVTLMQLLQDEHRARATFAAQVDSIRQTFGIDEIGEVQEALKSVALSEMTEQRALVDACLQSPQPMRRVVLKLATEANRVVRARELMDRLFCDYDGVALSDLAARTTTLGEIKDKAVDLARRLAALESSSPELTAAWRELQLDIEPLRSGTLYANMERALEQTSNARHLTSAELQAIAEDLGQKLNELRVINAKQTLEEQRARFKKNAGAKDKGYDAGRSFLEHQFSLQRPSAAMRDFLAGDPSRVVRDLKPIWMMSPLSVAETLPLNAELFDVVVFDEASQIPIEDAVPTLYRAPQVIVVGDEMQLPPPSYFAKRLETDREDLPDYIAFGMQAESLLDKAVVALPSTRLDWHYRSRHESLIGFCNQAFYAGQLKTIPSRQLLVPMPSIDTSAVLDMKQRVATVLERPISFHKIKDGSFINQQNVKEAQYVAGLVRSLLVSESKKSIGVVAFSQPQQAAIEDALERLASGDPTFRARLDQAYASEYEELFVKNLENVQGDERDIMIVSVAYARGATGRLIMNFGPINQEGGEKRLNVIFSRAKHHMVLVTSLEAAEITNDYNKGANALKRYMMYAAAASVGDPEMMRSALTGYSGAEHVDRAASFNDPLADQLAERERAEGRLAVRAFGQSTARCDIAVRDVNSALFKTAILTDNEGHYEVADVVDRYVTYPSLLRASGWQVQFALAKDHLPTRPVSSADGD